MDAIAVDHPTERECLFSSVGFAARMVRVKNRYLAFELMWVDKAERPLSETMLADALRDSVLLNFGDVGLASFGSNLRGRACITLRKPLRLTSFSEVL